MIRYILIFPPVPTGIFWSKTDYATTAGWVCIEEMVMQLEMNVDCVEWLKVFGQLLSWVHVRLVAKSTDRWGKEMEERMWQRKREPDVDRNLQMQRSDFSIWTKPQGEKHFAVCCLKVFCCFCFFFLSLNHSNSKLHKINIPTFYAPAFNLVTFRVMKWPGCDRRSSLFIFFTKTCVAVVAVAKQGRAYMFCSNK